MADPNGTFFWLDLEMTGLDARSDRILEAAWIITDKDFNELHTYDTAVYQRRRYLPT